MARLDSKATSPSQVRVLYPDHAAVFTLKQGATLTDLAEQLDRAGGWGDDAPTAVFMQFSTQRQPLAPLH